MPATRFFARDARSAAMPSFTTEQIMLKNRYTNATPMATSRIAELGMSHLTFAVKPAR